MDDQSISGNRWMVALETDKKKQGWKIHSSSVFIRRFLLLDSLFIEVHQ